MSDENKKWIGLGVGAVALAVAGYAVYKMTGKGS